MRVLAGWLLLGLAGLLLVLNMAGGTSAKEGCLVVLLALLGIVLAAGTGRGSPP